MPVIQPRSRMVNFRLSESEYEDLKDVCIAQGARSISEFTRTAVLRLIGYKNGSSPESLEAQIESLNGKVEELDSEVKRLGRLIQTGR